MIIHSFDGVLRQPRTMHTFQPWPGGPRVPLPRPIPMVSIAYFAAAEVAMTLVGKVVPLVAALGYLLSRLAGGNAFAAAFLIFYGVVPAAIVWAAMNSEIDGRAPYRWAYSVARYLARDKTTWCGKRARSDGDYVGTARGRVKIWWDSDAPRLQHGWVRGGRVTTAVPARFTFSLIHRRQVIRPADDGYARLVDHEVDGSLKVLR